MEPPEAARRSDLHLDHDRQGVRGSPDIMREIWAKIDAASVVVADVTPVSRIPGRIDGGRRIPGKRNMNPNVAIELGYAIKAHTDYSLLFVLNTHYGGRQFLPFDIAQKGGPLEYCLAPDADAAALAAERKRFEGMLVQALRPFVESAGQETFSQPFRHNPSTSSAAAFFSVGEPLAQFGEDHDAQTLTILDDRGAFLRVAPLTARATPFPGAELERLVRRYPLDALARQRQHRAAVNAYGAASVDWTDAEDKVLASLTQVFRNGEIWGFASWPLMHNQFGRIIPLEGLRTAVARALLDYLTFAHHDLKLPPPFLVTAGLSGANGYKLATGQDQDFWLGPIRDDEVVWQGRAGAISDTVVETLADRLIEALRAAAGGG